MEETPSQVLQTRRNTLIQEIRAQLAVNRLTTAFLEKDIADLELELEMYYACRNEPPELPPLPDGVGAGFLPRALDTVNIRDESGSVIAFAGANRPRRNIGIRIKERKRLMSVIHTQDDNLICRLIAIAG